MATLRTSSRAAYAQQASALHVVLLGMGGVGKSALCRRLANGCFVSTYGATIEDEYTLDLVVDDVAMRVRLVDTAGQVEYADTWVPQVERAHAVLVVVASPDPLSLQVAHQYLATLRTRVTALPPVVLAITKIDETDSFLPTEAVTQFCTLNAIVHLHRTSAKTDVGVQECFAELFHLAALHRAAAVSASSSSARSSAPSNTDSWRKGCILL